MILLVTGDREWKDESFIRTVFLDYNRASTEITLIDGDCRGADKMAGRVARSLKWARVTVPARWRIHGLAAGPIRNRVMLDLKPEIVLAFHDNLPASTGTRDCVCEATDRSIPVHHYSHGPSLDSIIGADGILRHFLAF